MGQHPLTHDPYDPLTHCQLCHRRDFLQGSAFWGYVDVVLHFGGKITQNP
jgi:hypothetical protein